MKDLIKNLNYDNTFLCTYNYLDDEYMSLSCYQIQLLQALNMKLYNDDILQKKLKIIYEILKNNREIENILDILSKKIYNNNILQLFSDKNHNIDKYFIFQILFSQDYFHIFHNNFSKYINFLETNLSNNDDNSNNNSNSDSNIISNHFIELNNFILESK